MKGQWRVGESFFLEWFPSSVTGECWRAWPQFLASLLPYSSHSSLSESWLAFRAIWRVNYGPHQWLNPALGKEPSRLWNTYANMTFPRLFYEARNNIFEMEMLTVVHVADCCKARVLGRQQPPRGEGLQPLLSCSVFPMDFCYGCMCYFSIICDITAFKAF